MSNPARKVWRDHPRVCGEHIASQLKFELCSGSSPRMRGTLTRFPSRSARCGIIPAYAGNTVEPRPLFSLSRDHPRVCGEHVSSSPQRRMPPGSSPRMRGTHARLSNRPTPPEPWDHPRVCGEHGLENAFDGQSVGSSPRMRGTLWHSRHSRHHIGIIPAYAGNTRCVLTVRIPHGDHPRVCGEHHTSN